MSFVPRFRNAAREPLERVPVKGPPKDPEERDDLVDDPQIQDIVRDPPEGYPPVVPVFRAKIPGVPQERDPVELENQVTGKCPFCYHTGGENE
ncbi:hypothetical protein ACROYT_G035671 [Oculina patagonica]